MILQRFTDNPILAPREENSWEKTAAFNGCVVAKDKTYHLFYRALSSEQDWHGKRLHLSTIGHATGVDGAHFDARELFITPQQEWEKYGCEDPRATIIDNECFIFYTALSNFPPGPSDIRVAVAITEDFKTIRERHLVTPFNAKAMVLLPEKINSQYVAILTVNTDLPPSKIALARFDKKEDIWSPEYWKNWYQTLENHLVPLARINSDQIEVGAIPVSTPYGWLLIYAHIQNYYTPKKTLFGVEVALLDKNNPQILIGRMDEPFMVPTEKYEIEGTVKNVIFPSGALVRDNFLYFYYGAADTTCCLAVAKLTDIFSLIRTSAVNHPKLNKYRNNPILFPLVQNYWESKAVFNAAALYEEGKVHIIYRAVATDNVSTFGYAVSSSGFHIDERLNEPIYIPRMSFEVKKKADTVSGCEDPRITAVNDRLYMCYTAYDGKNPPRVAFTSILKTDFFNRRFLWDEPVLISPPGVDDKDACLLPEKINNKYVFFHRINNDIVFDFTDDLNFGTGKWLRSLGYITVRDEMWDSRKIGIASVPIKTDKGWLLLYHGVSGLDNQYRVGAMLLDPYDPTVVLARTNYPVLEPEMSFERHGIVNNVVFPCGAVVVRNELIVYYGAADTVLCAASCNINELLSYLVESRKKTFVI